MNKVDFAHGGIMRLIFQTAGPMLVAQVLSLLYSIVSQIYIGRIPEIGAVALTGIGLCFPIILLITAFASLFGMGGAPLCAMERGKGNLRQAELIQNIALTLLIFSGAVLFLTLWIFARPLLYLLGASNDSIQYALPYLRIYLLGNIPFMIATGMTPFVTAQGFPIEGMKAVAAGAVSNIILTPVFIYVFHLGIAGAAIATVISQTLSAGIILRFLRGKNTELKGHLVRFRELAGNGRTIFNITSLGSVAFIMYFSSSLVNMISNAMLSRYGGDLFIAVMTIAASVRQLLETPALAICEGTGPILSFNYGAGNGKRVLRAIWIMTALNVLYTAIAWGMIIWKTEWFIRIFNSDEKLLQTAVPLLHLYLFAFVFQALQYSAQHTFKALNKKGRAIFFSLFRKIIIIVPLVLLLPQYGGLGAKGVFIAEPISNFAGGTLVFLTLLLTLVPELKRLTPNRN